MFAEVGDLDTTNCFTHGFDFTRDIVMRPVALKGWNFMRVVGAICKPEYVFEAEALIHDRTFGDHAIIERGRLLLAAFG